MNRKENNQKKGVEEIAPGMVYSRRMSADQGREIINTKENVSGETPSQVLGEYFIKKMRDPDYGSFFKSKLYSFVKQYDSEEVNIWTALEKLAPTDEEVIRPWLADVAAKSLVDYGMSKEGKTIKDLDSGDQKNYYKMVDYMEQNWKRVSALGTRNVVVDPNYLGKSELVSTDLKKVFDEKFGEIGEVLFGFVESTTNLATGKLGRLGMGATAAAVLLSSCSPNVTPTVEVAPTTAPTFEVFPSATSSEFSTIYNRADLPNVDIRIRDIVGRNLENIALACKKDNSSMIENSEWYIYSKKNSGDVNVWAFCDIKDENNLNQTVVMFYDEVSGLYESSTEINKNVVPLEDGSMGYYDQNGIAHVISKLGTGGYVDVFGLNGSVSTRHKATAKEVKFYKDLQLANETVLTATSEPQATVEETKEPTVQPTEQNKYSAEAVAFVAHTVEQIVMSVHVASPIDNKAGYDENFKQMEPALDKLLANYTGETIKDSKNGHVGINPDRGSVIFANGVTLEPIASAYFDWNDSKGNTYKVPILYFPAEGDEGKFVIGMVMSPTRENPPGGILEDNPAPDWRMSEIIKKFPMLINGRGSFEMRYRFATNTGVDGDEFYKSFFSGPEDNKVATALWSFVMEGKSFDSESKTLLLIAFGGQ